MKYIYKTVAIPFNMWTGKSSVDYLEVMNEEGDHGWKFVTFATHSARKKGIKGTEMIFEKQIED